MEGNGSPWTERFAAPFVLQNLCQVALWWQIFRWNLPWFLSKVLKMAGVSTDDWCWKAIEWPSPLRLEWFVPFSGRKLMKAKLESTLGSSMPLIRYKSIKSPMKFKQHLAQSTRSRSSKRQLISSQSFGRKTTNLKLILIVLKWGWNLLLKNLKMSNC